MDTPTAQRGRGKFARLCVELDLTKPLIPSYGIESKVYSIEYECMSLLCIYCGKFRYARKACKDWLRLKKGKGKNASVNVKMGKESEVEKVVEKESLWKVVQRPWQQMRGQTGIGNAKYSNRYAVLNDTLLDKKGENPLNDITNKDKGHGRESSRNKHEVGKTNELEQRREWERMKEGNIDTRVKGVRSQRGLSGRVVSHGVLRKRHVGDVMQKAEDIEGQMGSTNMIMDKVDAGEGSLKFDSEEEGEI